MVSRHPCVEKRVFTDPARAAENHEFAGHLMQKPHDTRRNLHWIVADEVRIGHKVAHYWPESHRPNAVNVGLDQVLPRFAILCHSGFAWHAVVDENVVEDSAFCVLKDSGDMLGGAERIALASLGHDVADIDLNRLGLLQSLSHPGNQEIWHDARENASRSDAHHIRVADRIECAAVRLNLLRIEKDSADLLAGLDDRGFA